MGVGPSGGGGEEAGEGEGGDGVVMTGKGSGSGEASKGGSDSGWGRGASNGTNCESGGARRMERCGGRRNGPTPTPTPEAEEEWGEWGEWWGEREGGGEGPAGARNALSSDGAMVEASAESVPSGGRG